MNNKKTKYDFLMCKLSKSFSTNELFISENLNIKNEKIPYITGSYLLNNNDKNSLNKEHTKVKERVTYSRRHFRNKT